MIEGTKTRIEVAAPKGLLVIEAQVDTVPTSKAATVQNPTLSTSQDIPATLSIAKTLLLFTTGPRFDRTATEAASNSAKVSLPTLRSCLLKNHPEPRMMSSLMLLKFR